MREIVARTVGSRFGRDQIGLDSGVPGGTEIHRLVGKAVSRQVLGVLQQVTRYAESTGESLTAILDALDEMRTVVTNDLFGDIDAVHHRLVSVEARLARLEAATESSPPAPPSDDAVRIHQLLAGAAAGDAITRIALNTRVVLSRFGSAEVYAHHVDPSAAGHVHPLDHLPDGSSDDVIIVRASIGDAAVFDALADRPERLLVAYHNITPAEFFEELDPVFSGLLALGRRQLQELQPRVAAAYADSTFNADDLRSLGYPDVVVVPPLIAPEHLLDERADGSFAVEMDRRAPSELILFVGQLLPHKRCELLIAAHHLLTAHHRPEAALVLVGAPRFDDHARSLAQFASALNLPRVWFTGAIDDRQLAELYRRADVFVTASSHEGFCVPVVEAMAAGVPVVTSRAGALPETVGCGGLLLDDVSPEAVAEALDLVLTPDQRARHALAGRRRARELSYENAEGALVSFLEREL